MAEDNPDNDKVQAEPVEPAIETKKEEFKAPEIKHSEQEKPKEIIKKEQIQVKQEKIKEKEIKPRNKFLSSKWYDKNFKIFLFI